MVVIMRTTEGITADKKQEKAMPATGKDTFPDQQT
jgi:hypothetical protein